MIARPVACLVLISGILAGEIATFTTILAGEKLPQVETGKPTWLGLAGISVNGRVHAHGVPTTWHVEYGPTADYGRTTTVQPVPPRLAAHYRETWDDGWNGWNSWCPKRLHFASGGINNSGYIRYEGSARDDHNHDDGIGTVHLTPYMYPGSVALSANAPSAYLGGGDPDFRDAIVRQSVRGSDWQAHGSELIWWSQAQSNIELNPDDHTLAPNYKHPNWCYTGQSLTDLLVSGKWETAEYRLWNDTNFWSYCGNNKGESRYDAYWSIDKTQRHLNLDLFHMLVFVDPANQPSGAIDFDEFEVTYHNYSLVFSSNGGRRISAPPGQDDPATLTDGWRHGDGKMWKSEFRPTQPLEFLYRFEQPVVIEKVQLHQHPDWPSKSVEVQVSMDGQDWNTIVEAELAEKHPHGANYNFLLKKGLAVPARMVRIRILSGYHADHWGLGEIELFGSGAVMAPDDDWFHVNVDLLDLNPGDTIHYRIVATNSHGATHSPDRQLRLPTAARPQAITGPASRLVRSTARVEGRLNPLGLKTQFYFEFGPTSEYGQATTPQYGGLQITPRLGFATLTGLQPGVKYHYRLVAVNEAGTSYGDDATFTAQ